MTPHFLAPTVHAAHDPLLVQSFLNCYLRLVGGKRDQLDQHPSLPVLHYWSQIAELYVASNQFEEAFKQLGDAADAFLSSAYPREFLRVTRLLLSKLDWVSEHYRFKGFEIVFHTRVKLLGYLGQYTEAEQLLDAYERTVPNKDTRYIHYCEMRSTLLWLKGDFTSAVQWGQIGQKLEDSGVDTEYDASHALALAERDSGHPETALPIFLDGETLATVLKHDALDRDRGGAFYGNIGRCLQFQGKLEDALVCYQKSALLVENDSSEHVLNQGYIRYWIGEVLLARGDRQLSQTFLTAAYAKWEQVAPPMANKVRSLLESLSPRADGNFGDQADAERICLQWIYGNDVQGRSPSV